MTRLVQEVLATVTVNNVNVDPTLITPFLVWSSERWTAAQDLATANGAQLFFAPDGSLTIQKVPSIASPVAWFVNAGADGVLITYSKAVTREETYNGVVAMGERADGVSPARAVALDTDPSSPTVWGGPFGKVPFFFTSPIITTPAGAQRAADGLLAIKRALGRSVSLTAIVNPALDAGDVIGVRLPDGTLERYLVDRLTVPLDPRSPLLIEARTGSPTLVITDLPATAPTADPYPTPATPDPYPVGLPVPLEPAPLPIPFPIDPALGIPGAGFPGQPFPPTTPPTSPYVSDFPPPTPGSGAPERITFTHIIKGATLYTFSQSFSVLGPNACTATVSYVSSARDPFDGSIHDNFKFVRTDSGDTNGFMSYTSSPGNFGLVNLPAHSSAPLVQEFIRGMGVAPTYGVSTFDDKANFATYQPFPAPPGLGSTPETVTLAYTPETLPEVVVKLDGVTLDPAANTYDLDFTTGLFTIRPSMSATVGQRLQISYTTKGAISPAASGPKP